MHITESNNSELKLRWAQIVAKNQHKPGFQHIRNFLTSQVRICTLFIIHSALWTIKMINCMNRDRFSLFLKMDFSCFGYRGNKSTHFLFIGPFGMDQKRQRLWQWRYFQRHRISFTSMSAIT